MPIPTLLELVDSGAHYGHHRSFVYPKAREFVYGVRRNIALIDLVKTQDQLQLAQKAFTAAKDNGQTVLFVGTKRGIRDIVKQVAESASASYITERWLGGFLSNFETISNNIKKMNELEEFLASVESQKLTKIDRLRSQNKLDRYHRFLIGVRGLKNRPDLLVMASASQDRIALQEASALGIPVIALCDTDTNPEKIDYPIPANDDAPKAVELILQALVAPVEPTKAAKVALKEVVAEPADEEATPKKTAKETSPKTKKVAAKPVTKKAAVKKPIKVKKDK